MMPIDPVTGLAGNPRMNANPFLMQALANVQQAPVAAAVPAAVPAPVAAPVAVPAPAVPAPVDPRMLPPQHLLNMLQRIQQVMPDRFAALMQHPFATHFGITPDNLAGMQSRQAVMAAGGFPGHFGGFGGPPVNPQAPQAPQLPGGGLGDLSGWFKQPHPQAGGGQMMTPLNSGAM